MPLVCCEDGPDLTGAGKFVTGASGVESLAGGFNMPGLRLAVPVGRYAGLHAIEAQPPTVPTRLRLC